VTPTEDLAARIYTRLVADLIKGAKSPSIKEEQLNKLAVASLLAAGAFTTRADGARAAQADPGAREAVGK
jgi:hypothetical protein